MKKCFIGLLLLTGCAGLTNQQVATNVIVYGADVATIAADLPALKSDVAYVESILAQPNMLNASEQLVVATDTQQVNTVISGIESIFKASKDPTNALLSATQLNSYMTTSRSVYNDVKAILLNHSSNLSTSQTSQLQIIDAKLQAIDNAYNSLAASASPDVTAIVQQVVALISTSLEVVQAYKK